MRYQKTIIAVAIGIALVAGGVSAFVPGSGGFNVLGVKGDGNVVTENRTPGAFTKLRIDCPAEIVVRQGAETSVSVTMDKNLIEKLETTVKDGELRIGFRSGTSVSNLSKLEVVVVTPELGELLVEGAVDVTLESLKGESLEIVIEGAGRIAGTVDFTTLTIAHSGVGEIELEGTADRVSVKLEGMGSADLSGLVARDCKAELAGMGSVRVRASGTLDAKIEGMGSIEYYGNPTVTKRIDGMGSIERKGD